MPVTIQLATSPALGRELNEDRAGSVGPVAWVLDGASVPDSLERCCERDASWLVDQLDATFRRVVTADPNIDLRKIVKTAITEAAGQHAQSCQLIHRGWGPSSTVALSRLLGDAAEVLVLGDATALVTLAGSTEQISDKRLYSVANDQRRAARAGQAGARLELVRAERAARNRPGGYWIAADAAFAAEQAITYRRTISGRDAEVTLLTDGAYRGLEPYRCFTEAGALVAALRHGGPAQVVDHVRRAEELGWPRASRNHRSDDATIAWSVLHP